MSLFSVELTDDEFKALFAKRTQVRKGAAGEPLCPYCGNAFSKAALEFWDECNDSGTGYTHAVVECDVCGKVMWEGDSWGSAYDYESAAAVLDDGLWDQWGVERRWNQSKG